AGDAGGSGVVGLRDLRHAARFCAPSARAWAGPPSRAGGHDKDEPQAEPAHAPSRAIRAGGTKSDRGEEARSYVHSGPRRSRRVGGSGGGGGQSQTVPLSVWWQGAADATPTGEAGAAPRSRTARATRSRVRKRISAAAPGARRHKPRGGARRRVPGRYRLGLGTLAICATTPVRSCVVLRERSSGMGSPKRRTTMEERASMKRPSSSG